MDKNTKYLVKQISLVAAFIFLYFLKKKFMPLDDAEVELKRNLIERQLNKVEHLKASGKNEKAEALKKEIKEGIPNDEKRDKYLDLLDRLN